MEKQTSFLGIPNAGWAVIGMLALAAGGLAICAFVLLAFGMDIGVGVN
jgi:hypothetical protein